MIEESALVIKGSHKKLDFSNPGLMTVIFHYFLMT